MGIPADEDEPPRLVKSWDLRALTGKQPRQQKRRKALVNVAKGPILTRKLHRTPDVK